MDTRTGEIFEIDKNGQLVSAGQDVRAAYSEVLAHEEAKKRMEAARARGELVQVSEQVARQQRTGQRVEERRRQRKAAKAARRKNRG